MQLKYTAVGLPPRRFSLSSHIAKKPRRYLKIEYQIRHSRGEGINRFALGFKVGNVLRRRVKATKIILIFSAATPQP